MGAPFSYRDYSGFFPFCTVPYAAELAAGASVGGTLFPSALGYLVPLFWTAKDGSITAAVNYEGYNGTTGEDTGTITGTSRLSAGLPLFLGLTQAERTVGGGGRQLVNFDTGLTGLTTAGTYVEDTGNVPRTYSYSSEVGMGWFGVLATAPAFLNQVAALDAATKTYYTRFFTELTLGGGAGHTFLLSTDSSVANPSGYPVEGLTLDIRMNGTSIAPGFTFPFFTDGYYPSLSVSGSLIVDFDTFWTT